MNYNPNELTRIGQYAAGLQGRINAHFTAAEMVERESDAKDHWESMQSTRKPYPTQAQATSSQLAAALVDLAKGATSEECAAVITSFFDAPLSTESLSATMKGVSRKAAADHFAYIANCKGITNPIGSLITRYRNEQQKKRDATHTPKRLKSTPTG